MMSDRRISSESHEHREAYPRPSAYDESCIFDGGRLTEYIDSVFASELPQPTVIREKEEAIFAMDNLS